MKSESNPIIRKKRGEGSMASVSTSEAGAFTKAYFDPETGEFKPGPSLVGVPEEVSETEVPQKYVIDQVGTYEYGRSPTEEEKEHAIKVHKEISEKTDAKRELYMTLREMAQMARGNHVPDAIPLESKMHANLNKTPPTPSYTPHLITEQSPIYRVIKNPEYDAEKAKAAKMVPNKAYQTNKDKIAEIQDAMKAAGATPPEYANPLVPGVGEAWDLVKNPSAPNISKEEARALDRQKTNLISEAIIHDMGYTPPEYDIHTHDEEGNPITVPAGELDSEYDKGDVLNLINEISDRLYGTSPQRRQKDPREYQQLVGDSRISEVDGEGINSGVGGNPNYTAYKRYLDGVGLSDLLDARSENIVPEVRRTNYLYSGPKNEFPGKEFDPRGQGVSSSSYGIPFVYVPQLIRDLKKYQSDDPYSEGYQNSFALALLAALGLADAEGVERVPGLSGSLLPEYSAAERMDIPHMVVDPDDPDAKPRYEYIAPWGPTPEGLSEEKSAWLREKEAQVRAQGKKLFTDRFNTAMKAQGYDPGERLNDFREPLRRAMLIYALQSAAGQGDESAAKILSDLDRFSSGRRKAYVDGDEKEEKLFSSDIDNLFDYFLHPKDPSNVKNWMEGISDIENELDLQGVLSAALTGKYGDLELGTSLKNLVMDDLRSPEAGMPVSPKALDITMGRYNEIKGMLSNPEIRGSMLSEAMRDRAAYFKSVADLNKSPILGAYAEKLEALAGLGDYENLSDTDKRFLESAGIPLTSKTVLAQMLGSSESADRYFKFLDLDKNDYGDKDVRASDYFLPREDLIKRLLEQGVIEDWQVDKVENLPKTQWGLYMRNLVNALYGDLQDSVRGFDGVGNKRISGRVFTPWEKFQYVRHRNPKDYAKYRKRENIDGEDVEKEVWGKDFAEGPGWELDQVNTNKGQWNWDSDDVKAAIEEVKNSTGALSDETKDTLRRMGFLREANLLTNYSADQLAEVLKRYHGDPDAEYDPKNGEGARFLAKLDTLITAADSGLIDLEDMSLDKLKDLAKGYARYLKPNGVEMAFPGSPEGAKKDALKRQISKLISKYIGNDSVSEIGLKDYDTGIAGDLNSNAGDIYRFLLDPSRTMTRAQTYAANLEYMTRIANAEKRIKENNETLEDLSNDAENEMSKEEWEEHEKDIWELKTENEKLKARIESYKNKLQYGDNAVSFDQNSAKVGDADEVSATTKLGDEKAEDRKEALEDRDQYEETSSGFEKELADLTSSFDPNNVLKNLFIAKMKEIVEGKAARYAKLGEEYDFIDPHIQNWPTFNPAIYESAMNQEFNSPDFDIVKYLNDLSGGDVLDDANYDMLYGDGTPADKQFRGIFELFMPPSEEDFQTARRIYWDKGEYPGYVDSKEAGLLYDSIEDDNEKTYDEKEIKQRELWRAVLPTIYKMKKAMKTDDEIWEYLLDDPKSPLRNQSQEDIDYIRERDQSQPWEQILKNKIRRKELVPGETDKEHRKLLREAVKHDALSKEQKRNYANQLEKTEQEVQQYKEQPRSEGGNPINMDYDSAFWKLKTMVEAALKDIGTPETRFQTAGFNPYHYENSPEHLAKMRELVAIGYTPEEARERSIKYAKDNGLYYQSGNTRGTSMKNNVIRTPEMWADMSTEKERRNLPPKESRQFIWLGDPDYDRAMDVWRTVKQEIRKMKSSGWTYDDVWDYLLNDEKSPLLGLPPEYVDYIRENYQSEPVVSLRKSIFSAITPIVLRAFKDGTQRAVPFAKAYMRESSDRLIRMRIA